MNNGRIRLGEWGWSGDRLLEKRSREKSAVLIRTKIYVAHEWLAIAADGYLATKAAVLLGKFTTASDALHILIRQFKHPRRVFRYQNSLLFTQTIEIVFVFPSANYVIVCHGFSPSVKLIFDFGFSIAWQGNFEFRIHNSELKRRELTHLTFSLTSPTHYGQSHDQQLPILITQSLDKTLHPLVLLHL